MCVGVRMHIGVCGYVCVLVCLRAFARACTRDGREQSQRTDMFYLRMCV